MSFTDLTVEVERPTTIAEVNAAFRARRGALDGYLPYTEEELVSSDYIGDPASCILDAKTTNVIDGTLVTVQGWYDNEWGYASRCVDMLRFIGAALRSRASEARKPSAISPTRRFAASARWSASTSTFRSTRTARSPTTRASARLFRP